MGRSHNYKISPSQAIANPDDPVTIAKGKVSDEDEEGRMVDGHFENKQGINWLIVVFLIVGETAGGGLVALPSSMVETGIWAGAALTIIVAAITGYTGYQLGENWLMMQDRWMEYHHFCRKPYPEMAYRALGKWGRVFMSILMTVQQFCLSVVFLLLAANNISSLLFVLFSIQLNFCFVALIVTIILLPLLMLGSPKDFWQAGLVAVISTSAAIVFIFIGAAHDQEECMEKASYPPVVFDKFFLTYGTLMFAYGGHACFPTFQHDMKKPREFSKAVIIGYSTILLMYLPISIYGYFVYGGSLTGGSIIPSLQLNWAQTAVNILITIHVIFTEIIVMSPLSLTLEEMLNIQNKFGIGRIILRSIIMICVLLMALSVPKFGPIVDLVGGTSMTLVAIIMPCICYVSLEAGKKKRDLKVLKGVVSHSDEDEEIPSIFEIVKLNSPWVLLLNFFIIAFGVFGGIAASISAANVLISTHWDPPCYISLIQGTLQFNTDSGLVHCCGAFRNVTTVDVPIDKAFCAAT